MALNIKMHVEPQFMALFLVDSLLMALKIKVPMHAGVDVEIRLLSR